MEYTFYRIHGNGLNYVGSTTDFKERIYNHKSDCFNESRKGYNTSLYQFIRTNKIPWNEVQFDIIEQCHMKSNEHALKRERYWVEKWTSIEDGQNSFLPWLSEEEKSERIKQYRIENKDKIKEYQKKYRIENKDTIKESQQQYQIDNREKINQNRREKVKCQYCPIILTKGALSRHIQTQHNQN